MFPSGKREAVEDGGPGFHRCVSTVGIAWRFGSGGMEPHPKSPATPATWANRSDRGFL